MYKDDIYSFRYKIVLLFYNNLFSLLKRSWQFTHYCNGSFELVNDRKFTVHFVLLTDAFYMKCIS